MNTNPIMHEGVEYRLPSDQDMDVLSHLYQAMHGFSTSSRLTDENTLSMLRITMARALRLAFGSSARDESVSVLLKLIMAELSMHPGLEFAAAARTVVESQQRFLASNA